MLNPLDFIIHIDKHMIMLTSLYGLWVYLILFMIIFCETGLVILPFLPGDSLLFTAGGLSSLPDCPLDLSWLLLLLSSAAVLGYQTNYYIGRYMGGYLLSKSVTHGLNPQYIQQAHQFYEKNGGKTLFFARFLPILRTFVPFVAGMSYMKIQQFTLYNLVSGCIWVSMLLSAGYLFAGLPWIKDHFSWVIYGIILVSGMPFLWACLRRNHPSGLTS